MSIQNDFYKLQASTLIKNLEKRHMKGYYCNTKAEALDLALSLMPENSSIAWGGSESIKEIGLIDALYASNAYTLYDRAKVAPEQIDETLRKAFFADFFLMSSNAITLDGQLINIDGTGNRISALTFGPKEVIMIVGMNKVTKTVEAGIDRIKNVASPQNAIRLNRKTPCGVTGVCGNCLSPDCMCMHTVITRNSRVDGRIKIILVGESLGY
ncbi:MULTISPECIES: lactate utilization protein [Zhenhengia]|jgi:L-lactate utilization protein LutB|uniref:Lactate utilization protein n=1 Tax=Zhenhengia yiwuensis TaxID=2763666 RepID=A0A926ID40_9FIRM|nr:lactate utilization protein [Zhenhengia yiwuensis]MBC8578181.1 lactate utilization protein [Zhenhengia yiwuensis]MDY3367498.1 lactate utilization protein [Zhenhengia yiwuensis]